MRKSSQLNRLHLVCLPGGITPFEASLLMMIKIVTWISLGVLTSKKTGQSNVAAGKIKIKYLKLTIFFAKDEWFERKNILSIS